MSNRYEYRDERRRGPRVGRCLLIALVLLVWVALGGVLALRYIVQPRVTAAIKAQLEQSGGAFDPAALPPSNVQPGDVPAGPVTIPITDADANQWLAEHRDQLQGVDSVELHFVPGQLQATVTIRGFSSTATAGAEIRDGQLVAVNPQLGAPLNQVVDVAQLAQVLETRLNQDLATLNKRASAVVIEQGQMTITLE